MGKEARSNGNGSEERRISSWRSLFGRTDKEENGMDLFFVKPLEKGEDIVSCCSKEVYEKDIEEWQNTLVGNFLGRRPSFSFVQDNVFKIWKLKGSVDVTMMESGIFIFKFSYGEDKQKVIEGGL